MPGRAKVKATLHTLATLALGLMLGLPACAAEPPATPAASRPVPTQAAPAPAAEAVHIAWHRVGNPQTDLG